MTTRRVSKNLQQGRSSGEGIGYRGDNTGPKCQETRYNFNPATFFVHCSETGDRMGSQSMRLCRSYIFEFKHSTCNRQGQEVPRSDRSSK